jgi:hypothetical protein
MQVCEAMYRPIEEVADAIRAQAISPVELTAAYLDRIGQKDGQLNAFVHVATDALEQAEALAVAAKEGRIVGPLHGIPLAVKDNYLTADMPSRAGTEATIEFPNVEGAAVRKLREAGAILLGKTRMHEFAWGMETPPARNPFDTDRVPGGSSGGSGIAVAAGFAMAALGSDTGGSIRIPASLCGTVGIKPTFGRIGRSGIVPHSWSLDHAGPLTRNVADAALLVDILSGYDAADAGSAHEPPTALRPALGGGGAGLRVGVCRNHFFEALDEEVGRRRRSNDFQPRIGRCRCGRIRGAGAGLWAGRHLRDRTGIFDRLPSSSPHVGQNFGLSGRCPSAGRNGAARHRIGLPAGGALPHPASGEVSSGLRRCRCRRRPHDAAHGLAFRPEGSRTRRQA